VTVLFSVLTGVHNPQGRHLDECIASVASQTASFEHVVVDDGSNEPTAQRLRVLARGDERLVLVRNPTTRGIVGASQVALERCTGEFVVLVDHDDVLAPQALSAVAEVLAACSECDVLYTDHDLLRPDGMYAEPFFKPDFSPERLRGQNYITHLLVARRSLVLDVGGFRDGFDGAQDHDLVLRLSERARRVYHLPEVLYHWRQSAHSVSANPTNKAYAYEAGRRAVAEHCARQGLSATVEIGPQLGTYRVRRALDGACTIAAVVRSSNASGEVWGELRNFADAARNSIDRLLARSSLTSRCSVHIVDELPERAPADVTLVVDEHTELVDDGDLAHLLALASDEQVGLVGVRLLASDGRLASGGIVSDPPCDILRGWAGAHPGPGHMMLVDREVAAVRTAVVAVAARAWERVCSRFRQPSVDIVGDAQLAELLAADGATVLWSPSVSSYWWAEPDVATSHTGRDDRYHHRLLLPGRGDWLEQPGYAGAPPYYLDDQGVRRFI
jgi:GT2 family glycosyltransferase